MKKLFFIILSATILIACSKEKRVSRSVTKKDGKWKISEMKWQSVEQDTSGQHISSGTASNCGSFSFDDNSGNYSFDVGGNHYQQSFSWSVNDENISITKISQSFDFSGNITQRAVAFSGTMTDKKTIVLEGSETLQLVSGSFNQEVLTAELILMPE